MADPQHPAVPFEQAVDLLTGEPRPLRPQHPDISALIERLRLRASRIRAIGFVNDESAADADLAADNLEALTRGPVEDEEVRDQIGFLGRVADHIARVLSPATAEKVRQAASLLARLAREKASAEQELDAAIAESAEYRDCAENEQRWRVSAEQRATRAEQERDKAAALSCHGAMALRQVRDQCDGRAREIAEKALSKPEFTAAIDRATSAEQEAARLRESLTETLEYLSLLIGETRDPGTGALCAAENARRTLTATAGAEEPR